MKQTEGEFFNRNGQVKVELNFLKIIFTLILILGLIKYLRSLFHYKLKYQNELFIK